ncbi:MAG: glutathione-disulfide reductase [Luteimonas sp.]
MLSAGELGGTCVNVGCVPKKAMWLAADLSARIEMAAKLGFALPAPVLDWREFTTHRQRYIANIHTSYMQRLDASGVVLMPVRGRLAGSGIVLADNGAVLRAPQILIATGGRPWRPNIPGAELGIDSDGFFNLCHAPTRVAIVGGGYIAVELAGVLQSLGSRVDLLVRGQQLLDGFDDDLTMQLVEDVMHYGTRTHFGVKIAALEGVAGKIAARFEVSAAPSDAEAFENGPFETVIFATGRVPNSGDLGLEQAGVAIDAKDHILVDDQQRTNVEGIHAIGDVTDRIALTPVAIAAARRLMDRLFGGQPDAKLDYDGVATVVFAHPPLGKVGLTEAEARERHGDDVRIYRARFRPMLHALADSPQRSVFKLVCVGEEERVVGIHLLGEGADEILQGFAVAMKRGIYKRDLDDTIAIHPTSAEEVVLMR